MPWTGFAGATTALDIYGLGGIKTDWSDDNAHLGGEGIYGLAFALAPDSLQPGLVHAYDRLQGSRSPHGPRWDGVRAGTFWSILYYPRHLPAQDPREIWDWHRAADDSGGLGVFTFRDGYEDADDILVQFKAKLRNLTQSHDGPDGLGFRIIALGAPFVIGGGRDSALGERNQATVYPSHPNSDVATNGNTGTLAGTPLLKPDGGGHVIASMGTNNVGTTAHKRWFVTDFEASVTGAAATVVVADTTSNGAYWQLPTFIGNSIQIDGSTFTLTGANGASLKGTILHPGGTPLITIGTKARGSAFAVENPAAGHFHGTLAESAADPGSFPTVQENRYLFIEHGGDGDFLVVMTLVREGSHPLVSRLGGTVADAVVRVGNRTYALQPANVLYGDGEATPSTYAPPPATVTFDADGQGSLAGMAVQQVPYGGAAIAPVVSPTAGYTFLGWNKGFAPVVRSMTVTALYDAPATDFAAWIASPLYALAPADQGPGADPDRDGLPNLLEYVFVLQPSQPDGRDALRIRVSDGHLVLSYRVRNDLTHLTVTPKFSQSLTSPNWLEVPAGQISVVGSTATYTEYEATMEVGSQPLFLILETSLP